MLHKTWLSAGLALLMTCLFPVAAPKLSAQTNGPNSPGGGPILIAQANVDRQQLDRSRSFRREGSSTREMQRVERRDNSRLQSERRQGRSDSPARMRDEARDRVRSSDSSQNRQGHNNSYRGRNDGWSGGGSDNNWRNRNWDGNRYQHNWRNYDRRSWADRRDYGRHYSYRYRPYYRPYGNYYGSNYRPYYYYDQPYYSYDYYGYAPSGYLSGTINITSTPSGASVYIDGIYYGSTPGSFEVSPGNHSVVVDYPGYGSLSRDVYLDRYQARSFRFRF